ncbi:MAG TPA: hypothetical protein VNM43_11350 [Dehalococcoidia bacterium]|nr:hypothetical protein [Dehalococcoidia bacterium]
MLGKPPRLRVGLPARALARIVGLLVVGAAVFVAATGLVSFESQTAAGFAPGQVIHRALEYSTVSPETGELEVKREEEWTLVGQNDTVSKLRVFLRDSEGRLLQDGFIDGARMQISTHFASDDRTVTRPAPQAPPVLMWTESKIQTQLLNEGFALRGEATVAGQAAKLYERVSAFSPAPGESIDEYALFRQFVGPTNVVQRVYVGTQPFGLDMGEEAFYRDSKGTIYPAFSRRVTLFELVDQADAPAGVFDWPPTGR